MKKLTIVFLGLLAFASTSCTKYLDVNKNVDAPDVVEPHLRLTAIQSAYDGVIWDLRGTNQLSQYFVSTGMNNYGIHGHNAGADNVAEQWRFVYWLQGFNLELMIDDAKKEKKTLLEGMGYAMKAYSWHLLTVACGDAPLDDAFVPGLLSHRYNSQEDIYKAVRSWAYKAISLLSQEDPTSYGTTLSNGDIIYAGDRVKWLKFAYGVLARNYMTLSNKKEFLGTYADSVVYCADRSFVAHTDEPTLKYEGLTSDNSSAFSVMGGVFGNSYFQTDYAADVMTGRLALYSADGSKTPELLEPQIIADTLVDIPGHYDPRVALLLSIGTTSYLNTESPDSVKYLYKSYIGGQAGSGSGAGAPNIYNLWVTPATANANTGRWLYRDDARYPLMSYAEIQFCKAEALYLKGDKAGALSAFKTAVSASMDFTERYIYISTVKDANGNHVGGDRITVSLFRKFANEYLEGPYVGGLTTSTLSLSHIMMQKWVALYPWSQETWTDLRRYNYDLKVGANGVPEPGLSYVENVAYHKDEMDPTRVYKGFYLPSADVQFRRRKLFTDNEGAPAYRIRPRYNSEYMWNKPSLDALQPIPGTAKNYQTSVMWFVKP